MRKRSSKRLKKKKTKKRKSSIFEFKNSDQIIEIPHHHVANNLYKKSKS